MPRPQDPDRKSLARDRFGRFAEAYVRSSSHAQGADLEMLLEFARPRPEWVALDVATGGGHTALLLAPHVGAVTATDLAPAMLEAARAHLAEQGATNVDFVTADAEHLPFESTAFDLVTCRNAVHHFPEPRAFLAEAARVLRPGGRLVLQDQSTPEDPSAAGFINDFERRRDPSHVSALSEAEWRHLLAEAGFTIEQVGHFVKRHDLQEWARMQEVDDATADGLLDSLKGAPTPVREWMAPLSQEGRWSFAIRQILIAAVAPPRLPGTARLDGK